MCLSPAPHDTITFAVDEPSVAATLHTGRRWSRWLAPACAASLFTHGVALAALSLALWAPPQLPVLHGQRHVAGVELMVAQSPAEAGEPISQLDQPVVVMPDEVQIGAQHFLLSHVPVTVPNIDLARDLGAPRKSSQLDRPTPRDLPTKDLAADSTKLADSTVEAPPSPSSAAQPDFAGTDSSRPPRLLQNAPPIYPSPARAAGQQGTVVLRLEIDEHGRIAAWHIVESSGHPLLDAAAVRAVRAWQFEPALGRTGQPRLWSGRLPIRFILN